MKYSSFFKFSVILLLFIGFSACKKERAPRLIIKVTDVNGTPKANASVHVYPANPECNTCTLDPDIDKTAFTSSNGEAIFEYELSAVLDVDVEHINGTDTLKGSKVVKIERLRQKETANDYQETVIVE